MARLGNAEAAKVIRKSNYPDAENFVLSNVLKTPSETDALKMLTNMEQNQATKTTNFYFRIILVLFEISFMIFSSAYNSKEKIEKIMKKVVDNFSEISKTYQKFRPTYPDKLYEKIMMNVQERSCCWDCATGNGQVAKSISRYFDKVYATDVSENQIKNAEQHQKIVYKVERAEKTNFEANQFDLITVGQAYHWFDFAEFNKEVKRVSKNKGIICVWGYGVSRIDKNLNELIDEFYKEKVGSYWDKEIKHIENKYQDIEFEFKELQSPKDLNIITKWRKEDLIGHLNTWSSVKIYMNKNGGKNLVNELHEKINQLWANEEYKEVSFPIFMRLGKIEK